MFNETGKTVLSVEGGVWSVELNESMKTCSTCRWHEDFSGAYFMSAKYPELEFLYHIPNGGSRNKIEAANLKKQGVRSGVPDLDLTVPKNGYHGLRIEIKYGKNKEHKQ